MTGWISCGSFRCRLEGDSELIVCIPSRLTEQWRDMPALSETIEIHLEKAAVMELERVPDGWALIGDQKSSQAVFVRNNKTVFSLQSIDEDEMIVRVGIVSPKMSRLAVHYGIMFALRKKCVGLHGVTLLCGREVIILSAPSGTGKTTLAKLLEQYCDGIVVNGDFALLNPTDNGVIYEPTPFCGTSGRALNHRFRIDRIVFLSQAKTNEWCELSGREAMKRFMSNAFVPTWDNSIQQEVQDNILKCLGLLKVSSYAFAPTQEAAETFLRHVEEMN